MAEGPTPQGDDPGEGGGLREAIKHQMPPGTTEEALDQIADWLREKWGSDRRCPYCGNNHWLIGQAILGLSIFGSEGLIPVFQVTCSNCGQSAFISAELAELVPRHLQPLDPDDAEGENG